MKRLFISGMMFLASAGAFAQEKITLQKAVELTLANNLQIKQAALSEALTEQSIKQSQLALFPSANASQSLNFNFGRSQDVNALQFVNYSFTSIGTSFSSSVLLFGGFQRINQISQNKLQLESDKSFTNKVKNDLVLFVVTTYLQVLNNTDVLKAAQQQLDLTRLQLDRTQKLFDAGNNTLADLSLAKSQVANSELNVTNTQNQLDIAYLNLAQLMERDPAQRFEVVVPAIEIGTLNNTSDISGIVSRAADRYPDIVLAGWNRKVAEKSVDIAKGSLYPRLSLGGNLNTGYTSKSTHLNLATGTREPYRFFDQYNDRFAQSFGFSLQIPIFNGLAARIGVKRAKINLQNFAIAEQQARNTLNKTINQAVLDLRAAEKSYASTQSAYNSSKDAFNVTQQRFNVGLVNSLDYNQAQTNLNTAEFNMIQAKYNLIFRNKVIDYYLGNPLTF